MPILLRMRRDLRQERKRMKPLEELVKEAIRDLEEDKIGDRVESYMDYKSKYVVLKPSVKVEIALTGGKVVKMDVSDYFEGDIK